MNAERYRNYVDYDPGSRRSNRLRLGRGRSGGQHERLVTV